MLIGTHLLSICRQRAMRRKAMETSNTAVTLVPIIGVANGRCAERQWRHVVPAAHPGQHFLVANGRCAERQWRRKADGTNEALLKESPTGDAPKGNGDTITNM